jgi:hypothetical protein
MSAVIATSMLARGAPVAAASTTLSLYDHRDHARPTDSTATMVDSMLADLFARARKHGWLTETVSSLDDEALVARFHEELAPLQEIEEGDRESLGQRALVRDVLEYFRPVHAENGRFDHSGPAGHFRRGLHAVLYRLPVSRVRQAHRRSRHT